MAQWLGPRSPIGSGAGTESLSQMLLPPHLLPLLPPSVRDPALPALAPPSPQGSGQVPAGAAVVPRWL